jgi:hypothetical protein
VKETGEADKVYAVYAHEGIRVGEMARGLLDRVKSYFRGYLDSFERGRRKYGIWWVVFTGAMLFVVMVLVIFAIGLYFFILPSLRVA